MAISLNKPVQGDTDWATDLNSNWTELENEVIEKTLVDAAGDILVGTAADTVARLAVGSNGQVLTADSAETEGVKWANATGGGALELVEKKTLASDTTTVTFSSLDGDTDVLYLLLGAIIDGSSAANYFVGLQPNGVTSNQSHQRTIANGTTLTAARLSSGWQCGAVTVGDRSFFTATIHAAKTGSLYRHYVSHCSRENAGNELSYWFSGVWKETSTNITSLDVVANGGYDLGADSVFWLYRMAQS